MRQLIEKLLCVALLGVCLPAAQAFSPAGDVTSPPDNGFETPANGYNPDVYLPRGGLGTGPRNITEEYRINAPVWYYTYDASFIDYFQTNGTTAGDQAFAILNNSFTFTNAIGTNSVGVDGFSDSLMELPDYSEHINTTAYGLLLTDLKSTFLAMMMPQIGLEDPDRYVWTLRNVNPTGAGFVTGGKCPDDAYFEVMQRNYGIYPSNVLPIPSSYINDELYTYYIFYWANCTPPAGVPYDYRTVPYAVSSPLGTGFPLGNTAVASGGFFTGGFYTGLTRDDMAGLRYLLTTNNVNFENAAPGALLITTNTQPNQLLTTLPISLLLQQSLTNDPATLQGLYPGLTFASVVTNFVTVVTPTITAFYTNSPGPDVTNFGYPPQFLFTGDLGLLIQETRTNDPASLVALYPGLVVSTVTNFGVSVVTNTVFTFTNQPGPDVTNLAPIQDLNPPPNTIAPPPGFAAWQGTMDFGLFTLQALTNNTGNIQNSPLAIAQLQALYPGLVVVSASVYFTNVTTTNYITYVTNVIGAPFGTTKVVGPLIAGIFTNRQARYNYVFGNVMLDSNGTFYPFVDYNTSRSLYGTNATVVTQTIMVTNLTGAPFGSPAFTNITTATSRIYGITGDFFIEPTNWCGFTIVTQYPPTEIVTVLPSYTNTLSSPTTTNSVAGSFTNATAQWTQNIIYSYTNGQFLIQPGVCEPVFTNYITLVTNLVLTYQNTLLNVITNTYSTNSFVTLITTNIFTTNGAPVGTLVTNITQVSEYTNVPTGDFFIEPTNWCGYQILSEPVSNIILSTNTVAAVIPPNIVNIGQLYSQTTISEYTNHELAIQPGVCEPVLQFGTNYTTNVVVQYQYDFGNVVTNSYVSFSTITVFTTNIFVVPGSNAVTLATNIVQATVTTNIPTGDFFVIPPTWCGYSIVSTQLTTVTMTTNIFSINANTFSISGGGVTFFTLGGGVITPVLDKLVQFTQTIIASATNRTFVVQPQTCATVPDVPQLRQGIGKIKFVYAPYDSMLSQQFRPVTNNYTMVILTNSQWVTLPYQRIVTQPDILISAADITPNFPFFNSDAENTPNFVHDPGPYTNSAGPGIIVPQVGFTFNKVGDIFLNGSLASLGYDTNAFFPLNQTVQSQYGVVWASFDATTNPPFVYGMSLQNLGGQAVIQVSPPPPFLPDGTNTFAYSNTFSATGGAFTAPYTWGLAAGSPPLPSGLSFTSSQPGFPNDTISGTPLNNAPGTFDITVQMTDYVGRSVQWNYSITIH